MDAKTYIEQAQAKGATIPKSIMPSKNGKINIKNLPKLTTLISNLLDSGSLTIVREQDGVEGNLLSCILNLILCCQNELFSSLWKNLTGHQIKSITFIDFIQRAKAYMEKFRMIGGDCPEDHYFCLYEAEFLREFQGDSIKTLKSAIKEENPSVVLFDCNITKKNCKLLELAIWHCLQKNIAVIAIVKEVGLLHNLESVAKVINVWSAPDKYIIETVKRAGEKDVPPFSISFTEKSLEFQEEGAGILDELDRKNIQYESGVDSSLQEDPYSL